MRRIKVEVQQDRMGGLLLTPVSQRVRQQMRAHTREWHGHASDTALIDRDYDVEHFIRTYLSPQQGRDVRQGWPVTILMDPWVFGHMVGYDFHEVINP